MYRRIVKGQLLSFGVSGMLKDNALIMYDKETETFWSHYTGEGMSGPLADQTLEMVASTPRVPFGEWRKRHPGTKVLQVNGQTTAASTYASYESSERLGIQPDTYSDKRLPLKSFVLGLRTEKEQWAFPLEAVQEAGLVNVEIGGDSYIIFANERRGFFGALKAEEGATGASLGELSLELSDGRSVSLATGEPLEFAPLIRSFWFAWSKHHPDTKVWTP